MMITWPVLFVIGVFDAREQRIPNFWVLILAVMAVLASVFTPTAISDRLIGFSVFFILMLLLYVVGGVAAGDVKLGAVLGYMMGWGELGSYSWAFAFNCFFIGLMYQMLKRTTSNQYLGYKSMMVSITFRSMAPMQQNSTYMPLAPVMIISLAMSSYFSHFS